MKPSVGRIVHYRLSEQDLSVILADRASATDLVQRRHNPVAAGDVYPAVIVRTFGGAAVNLHVLLDGNDSYWATSRVEGDEPCQWSWPPRV